VRMQNTLLVAAPAPMQGNAQSQRAKPRMALIAVVRPSMYRIAICKRARALTHTAMLMQCTQAQLTDANSRLIALVVPFELNRLMSPISMK
jgi:hypothetical protein